MSVKGFLPFLISAPGVFSTPLPWPAELMLLVLLIVLLGLPGILKCFPSLRRTKRKPQRRSAKVSPRKEAHQ